jgi:hypothetical protein
MGIALSSVNGFFALGALLTLGGQVISWLFMPTMSKAVAASGGGAGSFAAQQELLAAFGPAVALVALIELLVNLLGLFAGIAIVRRRPIGPRLAVWWACLKLPVSLARVAGTTVVQVMSMNAAMTGAMTGANAGGGPGAAPPPGMVAGLELFSIGFAAVFAVILLIFAWTMPLVWLMFWSRPGPRAHAAEWERVA